MNKKLRSSQGVISVFVALMMAGILSLGTFVLEAGRLQAARTQLAEATVSASSSMLASYNTELKEKYGVLAMDTQRANAISCKGYMDFNSDLAATFFGNNVTRLYSLEDVKMVGIYNLTYPHILKRQLLTVAKYNISAEESQFNKHSAPYALNELQTKCQYVSARLQEVINGTLTNDAKGGNPYKGALNGLKTTFSAYKKYNDKQNVTLTGNTVNILPSVTGTVESVIPQEDINSMSAVTNDATSLLGTTGGLLTPGTSQVQETSQSINISAVEALRNANVLDVAQVKDLATKCKDLADSINAAVNVLESDFDGNLLLNTYLSKVFSNRMVAAPVYQGPGREITQSGVENMTFAAACGEYLFGAKAKEVDNQSIAHDYIAAVRLVGNLSAVFSQSSSLNLKNGYSVMAHLQWAYYETCVDMQLLTECGVTVPLTKDKMILPINNPGAVSNAYSAKNALNALKSLGLYNAPTKNFLVTGTDELNYTDSLSLALWFVPNTEKLLRTADLMQLELRYGQQHISGMPATFLMSEQNTYCRVECHGKMNSILPVISIGGSGGSLVNQPLSVVKYAGY